MRSRQAAGRTSPAVSRTDFARSKLAAARLDEADVSFAKFEGSDLSGTDLTKAVGWRVNFAKANLEKPPVKAIGVGKLTVQLQRTKLKDVQKAFGGTIQHEGDGAGTPGRGAGVRCHRT